ncbi:MAG: response regulator transcription factor [Bacillota bacterium]|nr:response regulator transcription factor [Bacillota bacterium]
MDKIRILLSDKQPLFRDGIRTILDSEKDMIVIDAVEDSASVLLKLETLTPDVIVMDIESPDKNGLEVIKDIKTTYPEVVVIILTDFDSDEYIARALSYGAGGYLLKSINRNKLIQTVREALHGDLVMPSVIAAKLAARLTKLYEDSRKQESFHKFGFSQRESEIVNLLVKGLSNRQIASKLYLSEGTTKNYVSAIYSKVGLRDRTQAVIFLKELIA